MGSLTPTLYDSQVIISRDLNTITTWYFNHLVIYFKNKFSICCGQIEDHKHLVKITFWKLKTRLTRDNMTSRDPPSSFLFIVKTRASFQSHVKNFLIKSMPDENPKAWVLNYQINQVVLVQHVIWDHVLKMNQYKVPIRKTIIKSKYRCWKSIMRWSKICST